MTDNDGPILVTGAAGCIGAWVVARLAGAGRPVVALDRDDDRRRLLLAMDEDAARAIPWETADITLGDAVAGAVRRHGATAIIHLAALQIPFCAADPVAGAAVNVAGHAAVLEAARSLGVRRVVYASSAASLQSRERDGPDSLYGVYKRANEGVARVYWKDWQVPSIGLRPHTVYGPGRDQGLTCAPTRAMLAAALGKPFRIGYDTTMMMQHVHEVADAFIACADAPLDGARVFDLGGVKASTRDIAGLINRLVPGAGIEVGASPLVLPVDQDDAELRRLVGEWPAVALDDGVERTILAFQDLARRGILT